MKQFDMSDVRRRMYSEPTKRKTPPKGKNSPIVEAARNVVVFEDGGNKISVPTNEAFERMLKEQQELKRELANAKSQIKTLTDGANILVREINRLSEELDGKLDRVRDDD